MCQGEGLREREGVLTFRRYMLEVYTRVGGLRVLVDVLVSPFPRVLCAFGILCKACSRPSTRFPKLLLEYVG